MGNVDFPADRTPEEWRELARDCRRRSAESWERSDTDGFLSQWASDKMAHHYDFMAEIAENGGKAKFAGVADLDGNLLDAEYREGQYGWYWLIRRGDQKPDFFTESSARKAATRKANNAKKGYRKVEFEAEAVYIWGSGPGAGLQPKRGAEKRILGDWDTSDWN